MIVKIQIPLMTNGIEPLALVYNRDRSVMTEVPISKALDQLFEPGEFKAYFEATVKDGNVIIGKKLKNQNF